MIATGILILNVLSLLAFPRNWRYKDRLRLVFVLAAFQLAGYLFVSRIENAFAYYGMFALFDFGTVIALHAASRSTLSVDLQWISFASLIANAAGWVAYELYAPSTYYNLVMMTILGVQLIRLMWITPYDRRDLAHIDGDRVAGGVGLVGAPVHKAKQ